MSISLIFISFTFHFCLISSEKPLAEYTSEQEVYEEDNEMVETSYSSDAGRCSVRLERISQNKELTPQLPVLPHCEGKNYYYLIRF